MLKTSFIIVVASMVGLILLHDWIRSEFGPTPEELAAAKRARSTSPRPAALHAVEQFAQLPTDEQRELTADLESSLIPIDEWLEDLDRADYETLCLGEDHEPETRDFLAKEFFAKYRTDVLLLETTPGGLEGMNKAIQKGSPKVHLLEVDIAAILKAARVRNPKLLVAGIEETRRQRLDRLGDRAGFRDNSIVSNFWGEYRPGSRHAVLFGALHCTNNPKWLYERLRHLAPRRVAEKMLSVRILAKHQDESVEDLVDFLDRIGFEKRDFVIPDSRALNPYLYKWFWLLPSNIQRFQAIVVFRD